LVAPIARVLKIFPTVINIFSSERQMPQVVVNRIRWKEAIEALALSRELAKHRHYGMKGKMRSIEQENRQIAPKIICLTLGVYAKKLGPTWVQLLTNKVENRAS
jgi:cell wall assembly regulator SMI1